MTREKYNEIENHMLIKMCDSAHDTHHIYRVLYCALDIAGNESEVDFDVLSAACLLHDIGREQQFQNPDLCHAQIGSEMAYEFLLSRDFDKQKALHVKECISSHRFRGSNFPESIEAKILFDADKLEASGALGIARTFIYGGQVSEPLYILNEEEKIVTEGGGADISSFFQEYNYKLKNIYNSFYTKRGREIAEKRQKTAIAFYDGLFKEISEIYENGRNNLNELFCE